MGPLGAAAAVVASDLLIQFGLLGLIIIGQTLRRPLRHVVFLAVLMVIVTSAGWALGIAIRSLVPGTGLTAFVVECALWLVVVLAVASPLANARPARTPGCEPAEMMKSYGMPASPVRASRLDPGGIRRFSPRHLRIIVRIPGL